MVCSHGAMLIFMTGFYEEFMLSKNVLYSFFPRKVEDRLSSGHFFPFHFPNIQYKLHYNNFSHFKCFSSEKLNTFFFSFNCKG